MGQPFLSAGSQADRNACKEQTMCTRWQHVLRLAVLSLVALCTSTLGVRSEEKPGWKPHLIKQGNGRGGWDLRAGECRFLHKPGGKYTMPFGLAQMDNGEVILAA